MSFEIVAILVLSGLLVGFTNTLAAGGSAISLTVFMALGLPPQVANGTNRVAIIMQNLSSTATFMQRGMVDWRGGWRLGLPTIVGSVVGSGIASTISDTVFQWCLAAVMVSVLVFMLVGNRFLQRGGHEARRATPLHYFVFFLIGVYGGYIYVGSGYLILLATLGMLHLNIVRSNVLKNFVLLLSISFSLIAFVVHDQVAWSYGLVHGAGNVIGAWLASRYAIGWGTTFLRWFVIAVVLVCLADVLELISIREMVLTVI